MEDIRRANLRPGNGKLLMLVGLPGSGKTTFARSLSSLHPFLVLESDRLRKTLVPKPEYSADEHSRVFRASHRLIDEFLDSGYQVLLDATNLGQRNRRPVITISPEARYTAGDCRGDGTAGGDSATIARARSGKRPRHLV